MWTSVQPCGPLSSNPRPCGEPIVNQPGCVPFGRLFSAEPPHAQRLAIVPAAEGPVIDRPRGQPLDVGPAVGNADGREPAAVAAEVGRLDRHRPGEAATDQIGQRPIAAEVRYFFGFERGKNLHAGRQFHGRRPLRWLVHFSRRPIGGNAVPFEALELLDEKGNAAGSGQMDVEQVAGEDGEIDVLGNGRIEDALRRLVGRLEQCIAQCRRQFDDRVRRSFQMKIAGVQEADQPRHETLLVSAVAIAAIRGTAGRHPCCGSLAERGGRAYGGLQC
jgi:hypothetical protein